jgi:hypothetical protein
MIDRQAAWCLLTEFTQSESLRKHALAVEACMRACANKFGNSRSDARVSEPDEAEKHNDRERNEFTPADNATISSGA